MRVSGGPVDRAAYWIPAASPTVKGEQGRSHNRNIPEVMGHGSGVASEP
jgi:hypothetical protein